MSRELWVGIVIGLIIGWIIEWIIDWIYWRRKYNEMKKKCGDDLLLITGVGPVIMERFNKAGIYTFKELSKLKSEDIRKIIGEAQNLADEQDFINQAKKFAREKAAYKHQAGG